MEREQELKKKNLELERESLAKREGEIKIKEEVLSTKSKGIQTRLHSKLGEIEEKRSHSLKEIQTLFEEL